MFAHVVSCRESTPTHVRLLSGVRVALFCGRTIGAEGVIPYRAGHSFFGLRKPVPVCTTTPYYGESWQHRWHLKLGDVAVSTFAALLCHKPIGVAWGPQCSRCFNHQDAVTAMARSATFTGDLSEASGAAGQSQAVDARVERRPVYKLGRVGGAGVLAESWSRRRSTSYRTQWRGHGRPAPPGAIRPLRTDRR